MPLPEDPSVITEQLGQFTREHANEIAAQLESAGISWWYKEPGWFSSLWEFGIRLFVDRSKLAEALAIAESVVAGDDDRSAGGP